MGPDARSIRQAEISRNKKVRAEIAPDEVKRPEADVVEIDSARIVKVQVTLAEPLEMSERQGVFMGLEKYNLIALAVAWREKQRQAYSKVWVPIRTADGGEHELRHDINLNNTDLAAYWARIRKHYSAKPSGLQLH